MRSRFKHRTRRLADLRKNRMNSLREKENIKYTNLDDIKNEAMNAKTFQNIDGSNRCNKKIS